MPAYTISRPGMSTNSDNLANSINTLFQNSKPQPPKLSFRWGRSCKRSNPTSGASQTIYLK